MSEIMLKSVYDLLDKNYFIPSYQRGYRWEHRQVQDLLDDLYRFASDESKTKGSFYCLQPVVVKRCDENTITANSLQSELDDNKWYEVIDGQQRLTTIYLLLKYLINAEKIDLIGDYGRNLFKIAYQTRTSDVSFINDPSNPNDSSPNAYYITEAYKSISDWFASIRDTKNIPIKPVRAMLLGLLTNTKKTLNLNQYGYVQVIWYETHEPDPIKTFTRLNIGKIPLKNAELIKALFLQKRDESDVSNIQQIQISKEWDQIEATLQNKRIWAFLNKGLPDVPTHIEFLFDVIFSVDGELVKDRLGCEEFEKKNGAKPNLATKKQRIEKEELGKKKFDEKYGTDEYASFRFFSERFEKVDRATIEKEWNIVREYYETFVEWYNNPLWYHYIGFLIYCGEPITNIYSIYKGKTKQEFAASLISAIKEKLNVEIKISGDENSDIEYNGDPIIYASKTKDKLKHLLVLYNIEYIIQKNKDAGSSYILFPFDLFKSEKWDIEHVDSFTTNPLTEKEQQKEWLQTALSDLSEYGIVYSETEKITTSEIAKIDSFLQQADSAATFNEVKIIVSKLAGEYLPDEEVKKDVKNTIGNLTLLNADINRGYGNSIFPSKKKEIISKDAEGRFIPICTKNVFLKNFIGVNNTSISWSETDMKQYRKNIVEVLDKFFVKKG